ncbi:IS1096 element passenger TnpR family protein [Butyrivibrio sp. YAB3001]|uniref:IS1096 element passenger TnpR family protein n=1 Tax=Butyrivibrio sp. YAB3001 TaxID=1520812 RepID=UPI0008F65E7F|nr:SEC-C metal-binding domain-containing protein [Butyrivibrio sp. YAB3001]SFC26950.1 SEC-C motif-containing protein [Butyrivibrio sp. YAB3001]
MKAYQLKITIKGSKPPIWRRCIVPAGISFSQLTVLFHKIIGWWEGHLSQYTFESLGVTLIENAGDYIGSRWDEVELDSSEHLIDEFFDEAKSFTYWYDFGDDWKHKVQIEKVLEDYEYNYPMVLKFKGDTPPEDCGGIWGYYHMLDVLEHPDDPEYEEVKEWFDEISGAHYDMELVNQELAKYKKTKKKIKPIKEVDLLYKENDIRASLNLDQVVVPSGKESVPGSKKKAGKKANDKEIKDAIKKLGDTIEKYVDTKRQFDESLRDTYGDDNVDDYYEFLEHSNNGEAKLKTIFDYSNWKDVTVEKSRNSMQDLMLNLRDIDIKNYMKYFQIPDTSGTKKLSRIKKILEVLGENPQYYLYMYAKDEVEVLFQLFSGDISDIEFSEFIPDEVEFAIIVSLLMGIIEVKEKGTKVQIKFAEDADKAVEAIREVYKTSGKKIYKELEKFDRQIGGLMRNYGVVEINRLAPIIKDIWGKDVDSKDTIIKTYLHCTMPSRLSTATDYLAGESYVVAPGIDAQSVMEYRKNKLSSDVDYRPFTKNDPNVSSSDMCESYFCWEDMEGLFEQELQLDSDEIGQNMEYLFMKTLDGCDATELFDVLCDIYPTDNPFILSQYWMISSSCVLETGIPHLMGHSRYEYFELTGQRPPELPITKFGTNGKKSKGPKAHLLNFPEDIQWELYELQLTDKMKDKKEEYAQRAEVMLNKYPENLELMAMMVDLFLAFDMKDKSKFLLHRMKKLDSSLSTEVNRMLKMIDKGIIPNYIDSELPFHDDVNDFNLWGEDDFDVVQQPVVREHPKIGRNDPCPCGSGKKFKKCCMGKEIYD